MVSHNSLNHHMNLANSCATREPYCTCERIHWHTQRKNCCEFSSCPDLWHAGCHSTPSEVTERNPISSGALETNSRPEICNLILMKSPKKTRSNNAHQLLYTNRKTTCQYHSVGHMYFRVPVIRTHWGIVIFNNKITLHPIALES